MTKLNINEMANINGGYIPDKDAQMRWNLLTNIAYAKNAGYNLWEYLKSLFRLAFPDHWQDQWYINYVTDNWNYVDPKDFISNL